MAANVDALVQRTIRALSKLSPAKRDVVVMRILEDDADLAIVRRALCATIDSARRIRLPLRRDSVM